MPDVFPEAAPRQLLRMMLADGLRSISPAGGGPQLKKIRTGKDRRGALSGLSGSFF